MTGVKGLHPSLPFETFLSPTRGVPTPNLIPNPTCTSFSIRTDSNDISTRSRTPGSSISGFQSSKALRSGNVSSDLNRLRGEKGLRGESGRKSVLLRRFGRGWSEEVRSVGRDEVECRLVRGNGSVGGKIWREEMLPVVRVVEGGSGKSFRGEEDLKVGEERLMIGIVVLGAGGGAM